MPLLTNFDDFFQAYDGQAESDDVIRRMCGSSVPNPVISTGSRMLLKFSSDGSVTDLGFKAMYEFVESATPIDPTS